MSKNAELTLREEDAFLTLNEKIEYIVNSCRKDIVLEPGKKRKPNIPILYWMSNTIVNHKYSSSKNYYYTREINLIVEGTRSPELICHKESIASFDTKDTLKRFYTIEEYPEKIEMLCDYYRYHNEVPRLFMNKISPLIHNYYDKKRRLRYNEIKGMLGETEGNTCLIVRSCIQV